MRWFVRGAVVLALLWGLYLASPYWTLWRLASAAQARDAARVVAFVNLRAVRVALAKAVLAEGVAQGKAAGGAADAQGAAAAIAAAAEPLLERIVTPEGVAALLGDLWSGRDVTAAEAARPRRRWQDLVSDTLRTSRWRGFRNVYVLVPPQPGASPQYRLQLRLSRLRWRLVAVELPPGQRLRLLEEVIRRNAPAPG